MIRGCVHKAQEKSSHPMATLYKRNCLILIRINYRFKSQYHFLFSLWGGLSEMVSKFSANFTRFGRFISRKQNFLYRIFAVSSTKFIFKSV